ncbi:MAG: ATP-binding protein, partial [Byssovorax sp.]
KNAEDRYQTVYGLIADLEECLSQLKAAGTIGDFVPGAHDAASDFQIPEKLYGREREREKLIAVFERAAAGNAEIVLLSGSSGIGKSALVNEIQRPITERRGYFTSGKFDKLHNAPHGAMIQAFQSLIRELLSESEKQINSLRKRLHEALGASGQVVIDVIPEVALIVGKQPPVPVLGPTESQNRFNLVFQRFINVFARREHPLAIFLDDLQWADGASLSLIRLLLLDPGTRHLLIIGTYRDNEVSGAHPLALMLADLRKEEALIEEMALRPLDLGDVRRMILDTLGCPDDEATQELARVVHDRTEGNPFFVNQFFTSLYTRQLLTFSADAGLWQWNLHRIQESSITEDIAGLMAERIRKLPEASQRVVRLAACIGTSFDLKTLAIISEMSPVATATELWDAVQAGLVLPVGDEYKYLQADASRELSGASSGDLLPIRYEFLHDRVREAAYALISDDLKKGLHLRIGRLLLGSLDETKRRARIFDIVNQLDMSVELIDTVEERYQLARLRLARLRPALWR